MKKKKKFIIQDWTGKTCFFGKEFDSFEDGWDFLYEQFPDDGDKPEDEQDLQEYYVEEKED